MIITMSPGIKPGDERVQAVVKKAQGLGLRTDVKVEPGKRFSVTQIFLLDGTVRGCCLAEYMFESMSGVQAVQRVTPPRVSVFHNGNGGPHHITLGSIKIGEGLPTRLVAGPCTVEEHVGKIIDGLVKGHGIRWIRGGAWKPRSSPYSFPGFGERGIYLLLKAARKNGVEVVFTEVIESSHIDVVRRAIEKTDFKGTVVLWVGARTGNPLLLTALGAQRDFPVMIKNGVDDERVQALYDRAEWVLAGNNRWDSHGRLDARGSAKRLNDRLILCLRGTRKTDPRSPWRFSPNFHWNNILGGECWAPVAMDPSHCAGDMKDDLVMKSIAEALRFDPAFIMVEGGYPEKGFNGFKGHCDVAQMVPIERMGKVVEMVREHNQTVHSTDVF